MTVTTTGLPDAPEPHFWRAYPQLRADRALRRALRRLLGGHPHARRAIRAYRAAYARYEASEAGRWEQGRLEQYQRGGSDGRG